MDRTSHFEFTQSGRTYSCYIEKLNGPESQAWWWFSTSGDGHRYAPFPAVKGDTQASVQERMIAYHHNFLARRAAPPTPRHQGGRPPNPANAAAHAANAAAAQAKAAGIAAANAAAAAATAKK